MELKGRGCRGAGRLSLWLLAWMPLTAFALVDKTSADQQTFYGNPFREDEEPAEPATETAPAAEPDDRLMRASLFDELYDTLLPTQFREGDWSLRLNPKLGDFFGDDYVRMLFGVRYSFSNYFDATADIGGYFGNPFGSGHGVGFYTYRFGARYSWFNVGGSKANVAAGITTEFPLGNPPFELSDGHARYEPYVTVSYRFDKLDKWLFYVSPAYQMVTDLPLREASPHIQPADRLFIRPGAIYYPGGRFRYSIELEYNTNALDYRDRPVNPIEPPGYERENWILAYSEVHELYAFPGITWFPSRRVRDGFIIPGNWDISLRARVPIVEETGRDFSLSLRLRWYYDYRTFIWKDLPGAFRHSTDGS